MIYDIIYLTLKVAITDKFRDNFLISVLLFILKYER